MIVFDLHCRSGRHRFEGWFSSSQDFDAQQARGLVCCPQCGSADVGKAVMAPNVGRKGNQHSAPRKSTEQLPLAGGKIPAEAREAFAKLAEIQAEALKQSRWVGKGFADQSRAMHYGEREVETIHGQASLDEAKALLDEGIAVMPLPFPVAPPDELN